VWVTHGYPEPVVRWLREHGLQARSVASRWEGESDKADVGVAEDDPAEAGSAEIVAEVLKPRSPRHLRPENRHY
jgi:putative mRNA 3-end processing factor